MLKKIVGVAGLAAALFLIAVLLQDSQSQKQKNSRYEAMQEELIPLNVQKRHLEEQLAGYDLDKKETKKKKGTVVLMFTDLDKRVYSEIYPIMKKYGYRGVLAVSDTQFPGADGCISITHFKALLSDGWSYCLTWDGQDKLDTWQETMQKRLETIKLKTGNALFFADRNYKKTYNEQLKNYGYQIIIHQGEEGYSIIPKTVTEDFWYPGIYGMQTESPRSQLDQAVEHSSNIIYTVGFKKAGELYDKDTFKSMLGWFQSYEKEGTISVTNLNSARKYQLSLKKKSEKAEKSIAEEKADIQKELEEIEERIEILYRDYMKE